MSRPSIDQQITFLYTRDLAATARFYEQTLGLPLVLDQSGCRIYRICRNGFVGFCQRDNAPVDADDPGTHHVILTLVSEEVDAWHAHLTAQGVAFEKPPTHNPTYGIYHAFLRDPNGYLLEIQRFENPSWAPED